jgi:heme exporter protein CcmD
MMDWSAEHIGFVVAAYAITGVVLGGVLVATLKRAKLLKAQLVVLKLSDPGQKDLDA